MDAPEDQRTEGDDEATVDHAADSSAAVDKPAPDHAADSSAAVDNPAPDHAADSSAAVDKAVEPADAVIPTSIHPDVEEDSARLLPLPTEHHEPPHDPRRSDVDEWGRSEHMRDIARSVYAPLYEKWFRAEWEGLEKIPTDGPALLVANHAGAIPSDAPTIMHGIETELGRTVYGLADTLFKGMPVIGTFWARLGGVVAHPDNAYRLLSEQRNLVLVFPEGSKGTAKHMNERYQLRRFGRGGFVEIAMRAGVPIIPIAVVGAEESMPIVANISPLAKMIGVPYVPITANMLAFGPLGATAYFPAKFKLRVLDPVTFNLPANQERYSRSRIMDESEAIREQIQSELYDMLRERRSVWFG